MRIMMLSTAATAMALALPFAAAAQTAPTPTLSATTAPSLAQPITTEDVIVTGTRQQGRTKQESPAPVDVISAAELQRTGQQNVFDALSKLLPSFQLQAEGYDMAGLVRSARLRGLSPDDTLVLVDGKRRHISAQINADVGPVGGSDPTDLDMIPISMVDHIEVLRDGAAAQYGSDAIAGVINIILKHANHGGSAMAQEGATYMQDGFTNELGASYAMPLIDDNGFFDIGGNYRYHDHTNRTGFDARAILPGYPNPAIGVPGGQPDGQKWVEVANPGRIQGDPKSTLATIGFNAGYDFGNIQVYSFGTFGNRTASAFENWRQPGHFAGTWFADHYPSGFDPSELLYENDYALTGGVKGMLPDEWHWDLSSTYGADIDNLGVANDVNESLISPNGESYLLGTNPLHVHAGEFADGEWTNNLDINKPVDLPFLAKPLSVAFGGEFRRDSYQILPGDYASSYGAGTSSYPGFTQQDSSHDHRENEAGYVDLATEPLPHWQVDVAGRFEHYSDVGNTETGKFTTRYDFTPRYAVRATISNGFRAPTLAQEYASEVNVGPTSAVGQLPVNSAAAKALGSVPLKPERSQNYSVGFVAEPVDLMHVAIDAYQIDIRDQVEDSGDIGATEATNPVLFEKAVAAFQEAGFNLAPSATGPGGYVAAQYYTNGIATKTRGVDMTVDYKTFFGDGSNIVWTLAGNINDVELTHVGKSPVAGITEFTPDVLSEITRNHPKNKLVLQALYTLNNLSVTVRETRWGSSSETELDQLTDSIYVINKINPTWIADLEIGYKFTPHIKLSVGADNLFNVYPNTTNPLTRDYNNTAVYSFSSPFGFDGGFYYARLNYNF